MTHSESQKQFELLEGLVRWHQSKVEGLNLVLDKTDADISMGNGLLIKAGTETHKGVRIGIILALSLLGKLPLINVEMGFDNNGK